jgi:AcrR family transcriptional regulator
MAPEDRRAALIAATIPLLREHGLLVSTRQIADAAGVAEGTIFGVFPDKASLIRAAVLAAFDPEPLVAALTDAASQGGLRERLAAVTELLRTRFAANEPLIIAIRTVAADPAEAEEFGERLRRSRECITNAVAAVFEPDRALIRCDPRSAAQLLLLLVMVSVHRSFGAIGGALVGVDTHEIVSLLLDGLLVRPTTATGDDEIVSMLLDGLPVRPTTPTGDPT